MVRDILRGLGCRKIERLGRRSRLTARKRQLFPLRYIDMLRLLFVYRQSVTRIRIRARWDPGARGWPAVRPYRVRTRGRPTVVPRHVSRDEVRHLQSAHIRRQVRYAPTRIGDLDRRVRAVSNRHAICARGPRDVFVLLLVHAVDPRAAKSKIAPDTVREAVIRAVPWPGAVVSEAFPVRAIPTADAPDEQR